MPFNFQLKNRVQWVEGENGIHFYGRGIAYSPGLSASEKIPSIDTNEISIEIWMEPDDITKKNWSHIITFFDSEGAEYFTLAQWNNNLIVISNRTLKKKPNKLIDNLWVRDVLFAGEKQFVTITGNRKRTVVYLEGDRKRSQTYFKLFEENRRLSPDFILGSSLTGKKPWVGSVFGIAIYHRTMNKEEVLQSYRSWLDHGIPETFGRKSPYELFLFDEHEGTVAKNRVPGKQNLIIPEKYRIFRKSILALPGENIRIIKMDIIINILGFIPLGFILLAYLSRSTRLSGFTLFILATLSGTGLSLVIELLQVYLPMRVSSLMDLLCNSSGTLIGIIFYGMGSNLRSKIFSK